MRSAERTLRLVAIAALVGCASATGAGSPAQPAAARDFVERYAQLLAAVDVRDRGAGAYATSLADPDPVLRRAATRALGQVRAHRAVERLVPLLADADTGVAAEAAFALGLVRSGVAVRPLAAALRTGGPQAVEAAWSLGEIGDSARAAIEEGLADPALTGPARAELLRAAAKLRPVPVGRVVPHLSAGDAEEGRAAAYALARPRAAAGLRALLGVASSPDADVRASVARALIASVSGDSLAGEAVAALRRLASDADAHVRVNALRSLATFGPDQRAVVVAATRDADANVRIAAAGSLGTVMPAQRGPWRSLWDADTSFMFRRSLAASAVRAGVVLEPFDEDNPDRWQLWSDWRYPAAVAEAGAQAVEIERMREVSLPLSRHHDPRVRAAAYGALAARVNEGDGERHPWRRQFLAFALADPDFFVRAVALEALAPRARAAEVAAALESWRLAAGDSANDARIAAVRFLASAWRNDSGAFGDSLVRAIRDWSPPPDPLVRAAAGGASIFARWDSASDEPRRADHYGRVAREIVAPAAGGRLPRVEIITEKGTMTLELFALDAPMTVDNFLSLARSGFYRDLRFHRVVPNFVAQDGDPRGDGNGGPGYTIRDELNRRRYRRGVVGMALSGPDTGGSQYFITHSPQPHLDGHYTVFGRVVAGLDVLDTLVQGDRILEVRAP
ncbi:MAG TPA: peptidylprolyl isomerase [Gemmatimonadaceae bacterium]|nr:peptidylprolyl isomerase [Gemmatimonadaceae bacterium]